MLENLKLINTKVSDLLSRTLSVFTNQYSTPSNPTTNQVKVYTKNNELFTLDSSGKETNLTTRLDSSIKNSSNVSGVTVQDALNTLIVSTSSKADIDTMFAPFASIYVSSTRGNDVSGNGKKTKPFATRQAALNSFTAGSPHTLYVEGNTNDSLSFRVNDQSMRIITEAKSIHSGNITLQGINTSIYFDSIGGLSSYNNITVNNGGAGTLYFNNCDLTGTTFNESGASGYTEFGANTAIDNLTINLSGNKYVKALGTGSSVTLNQSKGIFDGALLTGSIKTYITGTSDTAMATILRAGCQLLKDTNGKSLVCSAVPSALSVVYLIGCSTAQANGSFGKIDFTGAGANMLCYVWSNCQLASSGDVFPITGKQLPNSAMNLLASTTATNYTPTDTSVKGHLDGINTSLGTKTTGASSSINNELVLFSGTSGKQLQRATGSGLVKISSGVVSTATAGTDFETPTNKSTDSSFALSDNIKYPTTLATKTALDLKLNTSLKGAVNGLAELGADGRVLSSQLPSFVDDVLEFNTISNFPVSGETGKIYVATGTNIVYRWSGTGYVEISASLALGETSSTAYRGDRGKTAYDHSQITAGNPHGTTKTDIGLSNVDNTSDLNKPISTATQTALNNLNLTKADKVPNNINIGNLTVDGNIGTAAATVDIYEMATVTQTTAGRTATLPTPTGSSKKYFDLYNSPSSTQSIVFYGNSLAPGKVQRMYFDGTQWSPYSGGGGSGTSALTKQSITAIAGASADSQLISQWSKIYYIDSSNNSLNLTLPPHSSGSDGLEIELKKISSDVNFIKLVCNGSSTLDGTQTFEFLIRLNDSITIRSDGSNGFIFSKKVAINTQLVYKTNHGFTSTNPLICLNNGNYALAKANSEYTSDVVGLLLNVIDINSFLMATPNQTISNLSMSLTAYKQYFLSDSIDGGLSGTDPILNGNISSPVLVSTSTNSGFFRVQRPVKLSTFARRVTVTDTTLTLTSLYQDIICINTADIYIYLPSLSISDGLPFRIHRYGTGRVYIQGFSTDLIDQLNLSKANILSIANTGDCYDILGIYKPGILSMWILM